MSHCVEKDKKQIHKNMSKFTEILFFLSYKYLEFNTDVFKITGIIHIKCKSSEINIIVENNMTASNGNKMYEVKSMTISLKLLI